MWQSDVIDDTEEILNDLLSRWHHWDDHFRPVAGYNTCSSGMEQYRASRQYDSENGALDQDQENGTLAAVGACIYAIEQPWRTALLINARNLCTGTTVWRSARLPQDDMERALLVAEARARLTHLMEKRGLL